jgi:hypothetical protein
MKHAKTSVSTEIFAGAIISVIQCLATLRYLTLGSNDVAQPDKFVLLWISVHGTNQHF